MLRFPTLFQPSRDTSGPRQVQHAALPFVETAEGALVCLITSRKTGRWVVPKGWPKPGMAPHELAALEAYEEAGLKGHISNTPLGNFDYVKRLHVFSSIVCTVDLYPLQVHEQLLDWPERESRHLDWMTPERAAKLVAEPDLSSLIAAFEPPRIVA